MTFYHASLEKGQSQWHSEWARQCHSRALHISGQYDCINFWSWLKLDYCHLFYFRRKWVKNKLNRLKYLRSQLNDAHLTIPSLRYSWTLSDQWEHFPYSESFTVKFRHLGLKWWHILSGERHDLYYANFPKYNSKSSWSMTFIFDRFRSIMLFLTFKFCLSLKSK